MRFTRIWLVLALIIPMAACSSVFGETPEQQIYAVKSQYLTALNLVEKYEGLPRCLAGQTFLQNACSEQPVVDTIRKVVHTSWDAIKGAETVIYTPGVADSNVKLAIASAQQAVVTFSNAANALGVK